MVTNWLTAIFQTVIVEVRKEILIDAIKKGLFIKEIYPLLGYPEPSNVYWFAKRFLGMSFNDFYRKTRKNMIWLHLDRMAECLLSLLML